MSRQIALKTRGVASVSTRTSQRWMEQLLGKDQARSPPKQFVSYIVHFHYLPLEGGFRRLLIL